MANIVPPIIYICGQTEPKYTLFFTKTGAHLVDFYLYKAQTIASIFVPEMPPLSRFCSAHFDYTAVVINISICRFLGLKMKWSKYTLTNC